MAKKISKVLASERNYQVRPFALVDHTHDFYPPTVADLTARDAISGDQRFEGAIVYVKSDQTTYQLRGGSANANWVTLVSAGGISSHTALADIGTNTHDQIDTHIADATVHFTQAAISITESQISDLQAYALVSHDHTGVYLGVNDAAASADALSTTGAAVDVSAAAPPVTGQILTATSATTATWQTPASAGVGDILQIGTMSDQYIAFFTADKNLSGNANYTFDDATGLQTIKASNPELRLQDNNSAAATMTAELSFWDTTAVVGRVRMDGAGNLRIENTAGSISFDTGTSDVTVSGNGDLSIGNNLVVTGYLTTYGGTPADGSILQWNTTNGRAEFTLGSVMASGTPLDNQIAVFNAAATIEGDPTFLWDGADFTAGDLFWDGSADQLKLGGADLTTPGLEIDGNATATPFINLQQLGVTRGVFRYSNTSTRLELSSTADDITLRPGNVDTLTVSQALITSIADILITRAAPRIHLQETGAAVNNTRWDILLDTEQLQFRVLADDELTHTDWLTVDRTLNVIDTVSFIATTFNVTGNITVSGTVDGRDILADGTAQDSHIADATIHFTEASIDHTAILNIGTNTHDQIDTHIADGTVHYTQASISIPLSQINDITAAAAEVNLLDLSGLTVGWVLSADSATTASWKAPTGGSGIGGSISDNQVAIGAATADQIEGSATLTYDATYLKIDDVAPFGLMLTNTSGGANAKKFSFDNYLGIAGIRFWNDAESTPTELVTYQRSGTTATTISHQGNRFVFFPDSTDQGFDIYHNILTLGDEFSVSNTRIENQLTQDTLQLRGGNLNFGSFLQLNGSLATNANDITLGHGSTATVFNYDYSTGQVQLRSGGASPVTAVTIDNSQHVTFAEKVIFDASTTADPSFNVPEGVAPTTPVDGDFWITAAGEANMHLNGVTVNLAASGIGGSITDNQIAVGATAANDIEGNADFSYDLANRRLILAGDAVGSTWPRLVMRDNFGGADHKAIEMSSQGGDFAIGIVDDSYGNLKNFFTATRSGTGASIQVDDITAIAWNNIYLYTTGTSGTGAPRLALTGATAQINSLAAGDPKLQLAQANAEVAFIQYANGTGVTTFDADGDITLAPSNTATHIFTSVDAQLGNYTFDTNQVVGAGQDNFVLTYDNATGEISLEAAAAGAGIGGSITDNQVAVGAATANDIEGSSALTFDGVDDFQVGDDSTTAFPKAILAGSVTSTPAVYLRQATNDVASFLWDHGGTRLRIASDGLIEFRPSNTTLGSGLVRFQSTEVKLGNFVFDSDQAVGVGQDNFVLTYDNGTGTISLEAAAGGGIGGSITDNQIAVGATTANDIEGNAALTFDSTIHYLYVGDSTVSTPTLFIRAAAAGSPSLTMSETGGAGTVFSITHNGATEDLIMDSDSNYSFRIGGTERMAISSSAITAGSGIQVATTASTATRAGFNIAPGVAPTIPANGDHWITGAAYNVRLNGVTVDLAASTGIGGSITDNQIAVGATTADDIEGSTGLTFDSATTLLKLDGNVARFDTNYSGGALDQKYWRFSWGTTFLGRIFDDALTNSYDWLSVARSGTGAGVQVDTIDFTAATDVTVNSDFVVTGNFTSTGIDDNATSNALTIDASQNATFEGGVTVNASGAGDTPFRVESTDSNVYMLLVDDTAATASSTSIQSANGIMYLRTNGVGTGTGGDIALTLDASQNATFAKKVIFDASTTADPSLNIPEGVAPTTPVDGDVWVTAAGAFNARLNGVTRNLAASSQFLSENLVVKTADESVTNSTTLQDDNDLSVSLDANSYYKIVAHLWILSSSSTPDFKYDWVEADGTWVNLRMDGGNEVIRGYQASSTGVLTLIGTIPEAMLFEFVVATGGTGGTFKLQWAQNTLDAVNATTLKAGSYMHVQKMS